MYILAIPSGQFQILMFYSTQHWKAGSSLGTKPTHTFTIKSIMSTAVQLATCCGLSLLCSSVKDTESSFALIHKGLANNLSTLCFQIVRL